MLLPVLLLLLLQSASPADRAAKAKQALLQGDAAGAVRLYQELVKELPEDAGLRLNLALALEASGNSAGELAQLKIVTRQRPELTAAWLLTGLALQKTGHPADAIAPLKKVLEREPGNATALLELADAYLASGDAMSAAQRFEALTKQNPVLPKGWQGLGLSYTALSNAAFHRLDNENPHSDEWRLLAAESELERGQPERAFALLKEIDPKMAGVHAALALVYEKSGHADWAATARAGQASERAAGNENPQYRDVLRYREAAQQAFNKLAALPESPEIHELLAEAMQQQGRREEALTEWRRAVELAPRDNRLTGRLAESLLTNRSYPEALRLLEPLVASNPNHADWQYLLGDVLVRERRTEEALPHLERAVALNAGLTAAQASLGRALLQLGQAAKAIPHLQAGVPADEEAILFQLSQAYRATGQAALAAKTLVRQQEALRRNTGQPAPAGPLPPITPP